MAKCSFCGEPAGFLRKKHKECQAKHDNGWSRMLDVAADSVVGKAPRERLESRLRDIAACSYIPSSRIRDAMVRGWEKAVDHFLDDGDLDETEESQLSEFASLFSLSQEDLDSKGSYSRMVKGAILRDVLKGMIPERLRVQGDLLFNFQKAEKLIWLFPDVAYYEDRKRREYVGGHHGVSLRVAKGVYYRVGAFKGRPVETTETVAVGSGPMAVTNKHIYFAGGGKSFRIRHDKIVTIHPYADGVGVQRDAQTAKPQLFITGDGWFTYNLLMNVSNL